MIVVYVLDLGLQRLCHEGPRYATAGTARMFDGDAETNVLLRRPNRLIVRYFRSASKTHLQKRSIAVI